MAEEPIRIDGWVIMPTEAKRAYGLIYRYFGLSPEEAWGMFIGDAHSIHNLASLRKRWEARGFSARKAVMTIEITGENENG